jgi:multidrug transporter EmrE-like cation transporter
VRRIGNDYITQARKRKETAVSVFAGAVFLHEPFSAAGLICCVLILSGIYGVQQSGR